MPATGVNQSSLPRLRHWNLGLDLLHGVQVAAMLLLANGFAITVTSQFPAGPPGTTAPAPEALFEVAIGSAVAVFLALAALDHLLTATVFRDRYESDLRTGLNRFRWIEYSFSATIMVILIGFYNGITGVTEVVLII